MTLFPAALNDAGVDEDLAARELRMALAYARKVRAALMTLSGRDDLPEPPGEWSERARDGYLAELQRLLDRG